MYLYNKYLKSFLTFLVLLFSITVFSQVAIVKGTVVDETGMPLLGATVIVEGTANGVTTDFDGNFLINIKKDNAVLVFSYIGFETQKVILAEQSVVNVIMKEDLNSLEEVQVVAFSKQKKSSVIGSVSTINTSDLKLPSTNLTSSFAGQIAGMISYQRSGEPGQDNAEFFIRGVTTFGYKNDPLILLDGLQITTSDLARIEPDNVASFSIMKDATATSLYGARGANGVILVTTKEGKVGKAKISVRYESSFSSPSKVNEFLGAVDYMKLYNKALRARDQSAPLLYSIQQIYGTENGGDPNIYPDVDWFDELFNDYAQNHRVNLNISGGGDVAQYYLALSHINESGLLKVEPLNNFNNNINIKRSNLRANINVNLSKTTKIATKYYSLFERYNGPTTSANDIFGMVVQANPANFPKVYSPDENTMNFNHSLFGNKGNGGFPNPYAEMVKGYKDRFSNTTLAQFSVEQNLDAITEGLRLRGMASVRTYLSNENSRSFTPFYYGLSEIQTDEGVDYSLYNIQEGTEYLNAPSVSNAGNSNFYYELVGEYNREFNDKHEFGGLLVANFTEALNTIGGGNTSFSTLPSRNMGVSGRFTYNYGNRYYTEFNFGYNGSEKFSEENRFGFFPSFGLGYIVSNETWFEEKFPSINLLKLKYT